MLSLCHFSPSQRFRGLSQRFRGLSQAFRDAILAFRDAILAFRDAILAFRDARAAFRDELKRERRRRSTEAAREGQWPGALWRNDEGQGPVPNKKLLLTSPPVFPAGFAVRDLEQTAKPADTAGPQQNFALA